MPQIINIPTVNTSTVDIPIINTLTVDTPIVDISTVDSSLILIPNCWSIFTVDTPTIDNSTVDTPLLISNINTLILILISTVDHYYRIISGVTSPKGYFRRDVGDYQMMEGIDSWDINNDRRRVSTVG